MGKRPKGFIALACLAAAMSLCVFAARTQEPTYQGRPLSAWIDHYFPTYGSASGWREGRVSANEAVHQMGTNGLPLLLKWFEYDPGPASKRARALNQKLPKWLTSHPALMRLLSNDLASRRAYCATSAFLALGADAKPAIPELARLMNGTNSAYLTDKATMVLLGIGKDALPVFTAAATDPQNPNRGFIILSLSKLGTNVSIAVPLLMRLTTDPEPNIQRLAKDILYQVSPEALATARATDHSP